MEPPKQKRACPGTCLRDPHAPAPSTPWGGLGLPQGGHALTASDSSSSAWYAVLAAATLFVYAAPTAPAGVKPALVATSRIWHTRGGGEERRQCSHGMRGALEPFVGLAWPRSPWAKSQVATHNAAVRWSTQLTCTTSCSCGSRHASELAVRACPVAEYMTSVSFGLLSALTRALHRPKAWRYGTTSSWGAHDAPIIQDQRVKANIRN